MAVTMGPASPLAGAIAGLGRRAARRCARQRGLVLGPSVVTPHMRRLDPCGTDVVPLANSFLEQVDDILQKVLDTSSEPVPLARQTAHYTASSTTSSRSPRAAPRPSRTSRSAANATMAMRPAASGEVLWRRARRTGAKSRNPPVLNYLIQMSLPSREAHRQEHELLRADPGRLDVGPFPQRVLIAAA